MTTAKNDAASTREDELFARVYQQLISAQSVHYAASYDASVGQKRFADWLQDHAAPQLDADKAMAQLYSLHYQPLIRLATILVRDPATAENVVLDAFIAMHDGWQRLGDADKAVVYLRQAVVNRCRSVLRHRIADATPRQPPPDTSANQAALDLLKQPAAQAALDGLPQRQREVIVLRYYSGLSDDQIATAMSISRGAVKSHTARGLSALRSALKQATPPPAFPEDSGSGRSDT